MSIRLTLPYPPSANNYKRHFCTRSRRGDNHPVRAVLTREAEAFKATVGYIANGACSEPLRGDLVVSVDVYRPRQAGDLDNLGKVLFDALQGIAYANDKQIAEIHMRRFDDPSDPRVEVEIHQAERGRV